jgi:hypothetical protein
VATLIKIAHLLALGAWSGGVLFFSFFVAQPTIEGMRRLAARPGNWLGLQSPEEGTRLAGEFLDIIFTRYFPFQWVCGLAAVATACWWLNLPGWIPKVRAGLLALALCGVSVNWWVFAPRVHTLRMERYSADPSAAAAASAAFASAHRWSLAIDLGGWVCVVTGLVLFVFVRSEPAL